MATTTLRTSAPPDAEAVSAAAAWWVHYGGADGGDAAATLDAAAAFAEDPASHLRDTPLPVPWAIASCCPAARATVFGERAHAAFLGAFVGGREDSALTVRDVAAASQPLLADDVAADGAAAPAVSATTRFADACCDLVAFAVVSGMPPPVTAAMAVVLPSAIGILTRKLARQAPPRVVDGQLWDPATSDGGGLLPAAPAIRVAVSALVAFVFHWETLVLVRHRPRSLPAPADAPPPLLTDATTTDDDVAAWWEAAAIAVAREAGTATAVKTGALSSAPAVPPASRLRNADGGAQPPLSLPPWEPSSPDGRRDSLLGALAIAHSQVPHALLRPTPDASAVAVPAAANSSVVETAGWAAWAARCCASDAFAKRSRGWRPSSEVAPSSS